MLSLENSVRDGLLAWPGGDDTMEVDNEVGTQRQWKQRMLRPGVWGDAVFLRLAALYLKTDIIIIPAFRESGQNTTLGYTIIKTEKRTSSEPLTCSTSQTRISKVHTIRVFVQPPRTTFLEVSGVKIDPCWRPDLSPLCSQWQSPSWTPVFTFLTAAVSRARKSTSCWTGIS